LAGVDVEVDAIGEALVGGPLDAIGFLAFRASAVKRPV